MRAEAQRAARRAITAPAPVRRQSVEGDLDPDVVAAIRTAAPDHRLGDVYVRRYGVATAALEHDRLAEARRIVRGLVEALPTVGPVQALAGLVAYRSGRWRDAVRAMEAAEVIDPDVARLPILADSYRALRRYHDVDRVWLDIRNAGPSHEILAEGRIVAAGAMADQGQLAEAIELLSVSTQRSRTVAPYHLRQWYVLADLYDRSGDPIRAAGLFERILEHDRDFVDAADRLRALGR